MSKRRDKRTAAAAPSPAARGPLAGLERLLALAATGFCVVLHVLYLSHAGGLWRDEANTVKVATAPTWTAFRAGLVLDPFPASFAFLVRCWTGLAAGASDGSLRTLGFLIGLAVLAGFWWNARTLKARYPLFSLVLVSINLVLLFFGDSLRAYGLGSALMLASMALVRGFERRPSRARFAAATLAATAAVQTLYQNALLLACVCCAAAWVAWRADRKSAAAATLGIGVLPALSLLPYLGLISRYQSLMTVYRARLGAAHVLQKYWDILGYPQPAFSWVWLLLIAGGLATSAAVLWKGVDETDGTSRFSCAAFVLGSAAFFGFLYAVRRPISPWYLLPWMTYAAVYLDGMLAVWTRWPALRWARLLAAAGILLWAAPMTLRAAVRRQTNADLVAERLSSMAGPKDIIVINPWIYGISFSRYYRGAAPWVTIPPISDATLARYDLVLDRMKQPDSAEALNARLRAVLTSGGRVWLAGSFTRPGESPPPWPAPTDAPTSPQYDEFLAAWEQSVTSPLFDHAAHLEGLPPAFNGFVNPIEDLQLAVATGWR